MTFDDIVIGAGLAGCILAARLTEDSDRAVLLVEAGPRGRNPLLAMPLAWARHCQNPNIEWGYQSEPEPHVGGRRVRAYRGRIVGGSGAINGMLYARGDRQDYEGWARAGLPDWSYAHVLPYFKRAERDWRGASLYHGGDGPISISRPLGKDPVRERVLAAARGLSLRELDDFHGLESEGFGVPDFMIERGRRCSSARAYLERVRSRARLQLLTGARVRRVLFRENEACGIEFERHGTVHTAYARNEVILAAGTFNSPHLLMLSGVGAGEALRQAGIAVVCDLPGVGENLQDHHATHLTYQLAQPIGFDEQLRLDRLAWAILRWSAFGTGPAARVPVSAMGYFRSGPEVERADVQTVITPLDFSARVWARGWRPGIGPRVMATAVLLRPQSIGKVSLGSADPAVPPRLLFNLLATAADRQALRGALRFLQRLLHAPPLAASVAAPLDPALREGASEAELNAFLDATVQTAMHPTGTCAMGIGPSAVVDHTGCVRGVARLRVADASVMPTIVSGNTAAATIMIAEKISDAIRGRVPLQPAAV